jgi:23S rRNA (uracil1939-C5)-methyltransferase
VLAVGQLIPLTIEKPAAGGSMIARADGQVVLVTGVIPGERVSALIERVGKGVAYARVASVEEPSADRREPFTDPLCGGCSYAHIAYPRQLGIKAQVIADAFARIAHVELPNAVQVASSPDQGYRMRARLHVRDGRAGFFREGTHDLCDARGTRQLLPATTAVLDALADRLRSLGVHTVRELEVSENVEATGRAIHLAMIPGGEAGRLPALAVIEGVSGVSIGPETGGPSSQTIAGTPYVTDVLDIAGCTVTLRRHVLSFFQANRFLLGDLMAHVSGCIEPRALVVDLYAGVGVFALTAAVARQARVVAVEGDPVAARDLEANAAPVQGALEVVCQAVESFTASTRVNPGTLIVDPPRIGMSREALAGAIDLRSAQVIYVSCDVATLARDARRLIDAGYRLTRVDAFDLFPNTPHVETVVQFERMRA